MTLFPLRQATQEALLILLVAACVGFLYSASTHSGLFAEQPGAAVSDTATAPEFVLYEEALQFYMSGNATFVDARHSFDFGLGHVKGAVNIPLSDFTPRTLDGIPKDRLLVVYCDGQECNSSVELAERIAALGFKQVKIFFGGWRDWTRNNQPTEQ